MIKIAKFKNSRPYFNLHKLRSLILFFIENPIRTQIIIPKTTRTSTRTPPIILFRTSAARLSPY